jgi:hypothetical protein
MRPAEVGYQDRMSLGAPIDRSIDILLESWESITQDEVLEASDQFRGPDRICTHPWKHYAKWDRLSQFSKSVKYNNF